MSYGCDKVVIHWTDTNNWGWDDKELHGEICDVVRRYVKPGSKRGVAVFTHSMGNIVLGAGIATDACHDLFVPYGSSSPGDLGKAMWFGVQGPNQGTPIALYCKELCEVGDDVVRETLVGAVKSLFTDFAKAKARFQTYISATFGCDCDNYQRVYGSMMKTTKVASIRSSIDYVSPKYFDLKNGTQVRVQLTYGKSVALAVMKTTRDKKTKTLVQKDAVPVIVLRDVARDYMWGNMCGINSKNINKMQLIKDWLTYGANRGSAFIFFIGVTARHMARKTLFPDRDVGWMLMPEADYTFPEVSEPKHLPTAGKTDNDESNGDEPRALTGNDGVIPLWSCA